MGVHPPTPLQMFERRVTQDLEWGGVELEAGSKVGLLFGAANHDEEVFSQPERLNLGRTPNPHVSFGGELRFCVGVALAREELKVTFEVLLNRVRSFENGGRCSRTNPQPGLSGGGGGAEAAAQPDFRLRDSCGGGLRAERGRRIADHVDAFHR